MPPLVAASLFSLLVGTAAIPFSAQNKIFGHAIKNGPLAAYPAEQTSFEHTCGTPPCVVTQIHVPSIYPRGSDVWDWENGRLRFYIDNETLPSVDLFLRDLASVGKRDAVGDSATIGPYGHNLFGKTAKSGGVYSTMRIPFGTSLRVTMTNAPSADVSGIYWFIIRGVEALPVTLGGEITLPDQARLRVTRNTETLLAPQELITLAQSDATMAGALVNVFLDNNSTVRYGLCGARSPPPPTLLTPLHAAP
jgi:hypothetical protein